ncbi:MAG: exodeoxyribonuclease VII small subunit [Candidatus Omnitrophota bacterium]
MVKNAFVFEKGMERLEEILAQFDAGGLSLDEMEKNFAEGMAILKKCAERLDQAELRVSQLVNGKEENWTESAAEEE